MTTKELEKALVERWSVEATAERLFERQRLLSQQAFDTGFDIATWSELLPKLRETFIEATRAELERLAAGIALVLSDYDLVPKAKEAGDGKE